MEQQEDLATDLLHGARAISTFLGIPVRRGIYLLEGRAIPAGKVGRSWVASKAKLRSHLAAITAGEQQSA